MRRTPPVESSAVQRPPTAAALLGALALVGCGSSPPPPRFVPASVLDAPKSQLAPPRARLFIVANLHGAFDPTLPPDGRDLDSFAVTLREAGGLGPDALWLDNGDVWTHAPVVRLLGPGPLLESYRSLGLSALNLGPQDWEPGVEPWRGWVAQHGLVVLGGNVEQPDGARPDFLQGDLRRRVGGIQVCVTGLHDIRSPQRTRPGATADLTFSPYESALSAWLESAWASGCQLTVAMIHDATSVVAEVVRALPSDLPLDLAVSADGDGFEVRSVPREVGSTTLVHPGANGRAFALVEVRPGESAPWSLRTREHRVSVRSEAVRDPRLSAWRSAVESARSQLQAVVGRLPRLLSVGSFAESELGHFVCDAWLEHGPPADVALLNLGALRSALPRGPVTEADVRSALPFRDELVLVDVSGRELAGLLAHGEPVVGGLTWTYRPTPTRDGGPRRTVGTLLGPDGRRIAPSDRVRLVTNEFIAGGGDGFPPTEGAKIRTGLDWRAPVRAKLAGSPAPDDIPSVQPRARRLGRSSPHSNRF